MKQIRNVFEHVILILWFILHIPSLILDSGLFVSDHDYGSDYYTNNRAAARGKMIIFCLGIGLGILIGLIF